MFVFSGVRVQRRSSFFISMPEMDGVITPFPCFRGWMYDSFDWFLPSNYGTCPTCFSIWHCQHNTIGNVPNQEPPLPIIQVYYRCLYIMKQVKFFTPGRGLLVPSSIYCGGSAGGLTSSWNKTPSFVRCWMTSATSLAIVPFGTCIILSDWLMTLRTGTVPVR